MKLGPICMSGEFVSCGTAKVGTTLISQDGFQSPRAKARARCRLTGVQDARTYTLKIVVSNDLGG